MKLRLRVAALALIPLAVAACGQNDSKTASGKPATLFQFEDYMDPPFVADYEKTYGEKPTIAIYADEDEAFAKMRAGYHPDVMGPCSYEFPRW